MAKLIAYVANCLIAGEELSHYSDLSGIRDIIRFNCGQWTFIFRQRADVAKGKLSDFRGKWCETTTVEIDNITATQKDDVLEALHAICWLLSFATQSQVMCYEYDFIDDTSNRQIQSVSGIVNAFRSPFSLNDTAAIKDFVEQTYLIYCSLWQSRQLPVVFNYLLQAELPRLPTEARLVMLFVTLEQLKHSWALDSGIPFQGGSFRDTQQPKNNNNQFPKLGFKELLKRMLHTVNMAPIMQSVVDLRNEMIHSGLSQLTQQRQLEIYEDIQDIIREYLLRLLRYNGEYYLYQGQGDVRKTLP